MYTRADSRFAPSQLETALLSDDVYYIICWVQAYNQPCIVFGDTQMIHDYQVTISKTFANLMRLCLSLATSKEKYIYQNIETFLLLDDCVSLYNTKEPTAQEINNSFI